MAVLTNKSIASTYKSVLSIGATTESALTTSIQQLTDGLGNSSPLSMSTTQIQFNNDANTFSFPADRGTSGQILKLADANGTLSWADDDLSNTLDFSGGTGTGSVTLDTQTLAFTGTANEIETSASSQAITLSFPTTGVTLPDGSIATTQTASDNSTKVATTAYVDNQVSTAGTVTSVALSVPTGLTVTGSPITTSGTITIGGTLGVANGGTGATTLTGILLGNGTSAISAVTDGTVSGQVLSTNANGTYSFIDAATGDVTVDGASVGNRVAVWNNTTGELRGTSAIATENSNIYLVQPSTNGTNKFNYIIGGAFAINENDFGIQNTGFGEGVFNGADFTGNSNTAFGSQSQYVITTGASNTSVGFHSMYDNRSGSSNVGLGARTMFNQRISNYNVAIGYDSMDGVTASQTAVSDYNTAVGYQSLQSIQGGDNNTVIGKDSGNAITTGSNNVIIGSNTGSTIATSSNNIIISDGSGNIRQSFDINGAATFSGALSGTSASFSDNVVLTGSSKQIRLEDSSFVNFTNTGNTIQRGYIQHDGANLNIASPVGSIILSGGNVGIGTSSPNARFSVVSSSANSTAAKIGGIEYGGSQRGLTIKTFQSLGGDDCGVEFNAAEGLATYGSFVFKADTTELMRISSNGDVFLTSTGGNVSSTVSGIALRNPRTSGPINIGSGNVTDSRDFVHFVNGNGTVGSISTSGSATAYNTSSDYRLKENVTPITDALSRINQLKPSRFNFISESDKTVDGFLAHEVQEIIPEAINGEKDAMRDEEFELTPRVDEVTDEDGNVITEAVDAVMETRSVPDYQGIDQSKIVPLLTAAIQEQQTIIEDLKSRIEKLEG
jgi:hypothetical protein